MYLEEEHVYLFEVVIKNIYIDESLTKNSCVKNDGQIRIQFGSKVDSEINLNKFSPTHTDGLDVNDIRGGLSFLLHWTAVDLVGNVKKLLT